MGTNEKKNYTIDDIARELGVSKTTVSRAISGKGRIGKATRERVLQFIEEHDYRPNVMAKGLAQRKTYNLVLVLPVDYAATEFLFFKDCMTGICEEAARYDYDIIISMTEGSDISQLRRQAANRKADGMILSRAEVNSPAQEFLKENQIPFVVIGPVEDSQVESVDNKNREASEELTSIMLSKGITKIALLGGKQSYKVTESRYEGFVRAHEKAGVPIQENLIFMDIDNSEKAADAIQKLLDEQADGILCMDDIICGMALEYLKERQIDIPSQLKVANLYDSRILEKNNPSVTSVRFDTRRLGRLACERLLELLGENVEKEETPLNYEVILRKSTQ